MNSRTFPIALFLLLCVACLAHGLYYYPRLPAEVAHQFGASGQPDAWGSKEHFLVVYLVTVAVMAATFLGLGLAMPKIPNSAINLPNKEYWLAPERRRQTLDYMLPRLLWAPDGLPVLRLQHGQSRRTALKAFAGGRGTTASGRG